MGGVNPEPYGKSFRGARLRICLTPSTAAKLSLLLRNPRFNPKKMSAPKFLRHLLEEEIRKNL